MLKRSLPQGILPLLLFFSLTHSSQAQVTSAADPRAHIVGGAFLSFFNPDYGPNHLWGPGAFVDLNLRGHLGAEAEARFLRFNQADSVHQDNWNIGVRYRWRVRRWEPYGKFLIGNGQMNFPFSYGHGGYFLIAPGAGLDIHYHRFVIRAVDYEYQHWFGFQGSSLSPAGFSSGLAYRFW